MKKIRKNPCLSDITHRTTLVVLFALLFIISRTYLIVSKVYKKIILNARVVYDFSDEVDREKNKIRQEDILKPFISTFKKMFRRFFTFC